MWVAAPFAWALGDGVREALLLWPALSGAAIVLERLGKPREPAVASYYEEPEGEHGVLRQSESESGEPPGAAP